MCRWGCATSDTTYMCKWCGTRYCKHCLRGDFGTTCMKESSTCFQCHQKKCQGKRVEYFPSQSPDGKSAKGRGNKSSKSSKSGKSSKTKSASSSKSKGKKGKKKRKAA